MFQKVKKNIAEGLGGFLIVAGLFLAGGMTALAASISVAYISTTPLPNGTLVAVDSQNDGAVVPADHEVNINILGAVVSGSTASVSSNTTQHQVEVSNRGTAYVLVNDINGPITKGAPITSSPLEGIGMLSTKEGKIVGIAQGDLNDQSIDAQYKTVQNKNGEDKRVLIGLVPVALDVTYYQEPHTQSRLVPPLLQDISRTISDKEVSAVRIWGSLGLILAALIISVVLLYGAVRSSIGAIGRNPLAKRTIQLSLLRVVALSVTVLIIAVCGAYLILRG